MRSIRSKILVSMLTVVLLGSVFIGAISAYMNAKGIDALLESTIGPAAKMAASAVEWEMENYWSPLKEAAAMDIFRDSEPTDAELGAVASDIASRNGFIYIGKMDVSGTASTGDNYGDMDYFQLCRDSMSPYISDIMYDGSQMVFILEVPIITDESFDGIVYGAISADFLTDIVTDLRVGDQGYAYVLDSNGNVIGHQEVSYVESGSNMIKAAESDPGVEDVAAVHRQMLAGEAGFGSYNFYGDDKLIGYAPIGGDQDWSVAIEVSQKEFKASLNRSINMTVLVVIAVIVIATLVTISLTRSISGPIRACVERLDKLSQGDLKTPVPHYNSKDETAHLLDSLDVTVTRLASVVDDVSHHLGLMAQGDFRQEPTREYRGDFVAIGESIKGIHKSLNGTLSQISQSSSLVYSGAGQVSDGAQTLSQGTTQQAAAVEELAATMNSISEHIQSTAEAAQHANADARQADADMSKSYQKMQELTEAIQEINTASAKIGEIVKTIEGISSQTNILALNASVEAARAGESGKGFAVVADEVRNLASRSADASKTTIDLVEESRVAVKKGMRLVNETASAMDHTVKEVSNAMEKLEEISQASVEQAESVRQVSEGIKQISQVVQMNSASSEESAATAAELSEQSNLMNKLVGRFQLPGRN